MDYFEPTDAPEVLVCYEIYPGEPEEPHKPGFDTEVEITDVLIHGKAVSEPVYTALVDTFGDGWRGQILFNTEEPIKG